MRPAARAALVVAAVWMTAAPGRAAQGTPHARLFPPENLGVLESPDRDVWQEPDRIMDELNIADGSRVADLGAGGGWFTVRLARRVGPNGIVYAEDIQPEMIDSIRRRVEERGFHNVRTVLGTPDDPNLPSGLHAVLIVDSYPQFANPVKLLQNVARALGPTGVVGVVDFKKDGSGGPGPPIDERLDPDTVRRDAERAGLQFRALKTFLRYQYLLIFSR